jgi:hypothetical protein
VSSEAERTLARLEALVAKPVAPAELPVTEEVVERAAYDIEELYREELGHDLDVDALVVAFLDGRTEGVEQAFGDDVAKLMERRVRSYRIPGGGLYSVRLDLSDELL